jgi:glycosyltransferase involved in cell wall biosynthesis
MRALCRLAYDGPIEIIVVIDGSTDGTAAALARLDCAFPMRVIEQENRGLAAARNRGATEAAGDILLFLDDDMICEPELVQQHERSYRAGADAVIGEFVEPQDPFASLRRQDPPRTDVPRGDETVVSPFGVYGGQMSVRRSAFELVSGFDESFTAKGRYGYEDCDIAYRLLQDFTVRRNKNAVCQHLKRIGAREYVSRGHSSANAELYLLKKHPQLLGELIDWTGAKRISRRLRFLVQLPVLPRILVAVATVVAEIGYRTPLRSSRKLAYMCGVAYTINYWSTVQRTRGLPSL